MNFFELSLESGNLLNMIGLEVNMQQSPPEIKEKVINVERYIPQNKRVRSVRLREANFDEGFLNIYSCMFESGKCEVHFFGNLKNTELISTLGFNNCNQRNFDQLKERIKFILVKSRNILKSYYKDGKIKNIEHHIMAFLNDK